MTLRDAKTQASHNEGNAYLEMIVGPFRLALNAGWVLTILGDVARANCVSVHDERLPLVDLQELFLSTSRVVAPFAVVSESSAGRVAIGVDRVDHLRVSMATPLLPLPHFGLEAPELFAGAIRDSRGLLMVLDPAALISCFRKRTRRLTHFRAEGI